MKQTAESAVSESAFGRRVLAVVAAAVLLPLLFVLVLEFRERLDQQAALARAALATIAHEQAMVQPDSPSENLAALIPGRYAVLMDRDGRIIACLLYTSPSPRDRTRSRMPSSA